MLLIGMFTLFANSATIPSVAASVITTTFTSDSGSAGISSSGICYRYSLGQSAFHGLPQRMVLREGDLGFHLIATRYNVLEGGTDYFQSINVLLSARCMQALRSHQAQTGQVGDRCGKKRSRRESPLSLCKWRMKKEANVEKIQLRCQQPVRSSRQVCTSRTVWRSYEGSHLKYHGARSLMVLAQGA